MYVGYVLLFWGVSSLLLLLFSSKTSKGGRTCTLYLSLLDNRLAISGEIHTLFLAETSVINNRDQELITDHV